MIALQDRRLAPCAHMHSMFDSAEAAPPKGVAPHSLSYTALNRSLSERALGQSVSAIVSKGRTPDKGRHPLSRRFAAVADHDRERREWAGKRALPSDTYRRGLRPLRSLDVEVPPAASAHQTDVPFAK